MLENEYLELCNDLKEKFEVKEKEVEKLKEEKKELMKNLFGIYGYLRISMENEMIGLNEDEDLLNQLHLLRNFLSNFFDDVFENVIPS